MDKFSQLIRIRMQHIKLYGPIKIIPVDPRGIPEQMG
jgi:hypothetical protein